VNKKTEKSKNNNRKNRIVKKNRLNQLDFKKKPIGSVWFYKPGIEKPNRTQTKKKPNQTRKKPSRAGKNRAKLV
jgi:hypothetical protein